MSDDSFNDSVHRTSEGIPEEDRERAVRRFQMLVAGALSTAIANSGNTTEEVDSILGWKLHTTEEYLIALIRGDRQCVGMREIAEIAYAIGCDVEFNVRPKQ